VHTPRQPGGNDETVEVTRQGSGSPHSKFHAIALVEGGTPELSGETHSLLRSRLRAAALLLSLGFAAFFVRNLFYLNHLKTISDWVLFWDHLFVTLLTGGIGLSLCRTCGISLRKLRVAELLTFGGSALFFVLMDYRMLVNLAADGHLAPVAPPWLILIFTYALFIPNTWQRAAAVVAGFVAAPVGVLITVFATSQQFRDVLSYVHYNGVILSTAMMLALAATIAVWGVHIIGSLRQEAFKAKRLGQYRLKHCIGGGGMGEVYLAEHLLLKRPCAVKVIRAEKAGDPKVLARFEREVRATAKLSHWNTVEIFDYGHAEDGTFYYAMEYLPGLSLAQIVDMYGALPTERVIHLLTQVCEALSEAHQQHLLHRDIKPGNVFAAKRGGIHDVAKLLDFGLAKPLADAEEDSALTQEGAITGSPLFMSPEQASGSREPDARSDIYSLGAVAYYLLSGRPPFDSEKPIQVMIAHAHEEPEPPTVYNPSIPADIEQVVMRCLEKDPDLRYQDAESLRLALLECHGAGTWTREMAACWWEDYGCPKKKALDAEALKAAAV